MRPHQQRVLDEKRELDERLVKLSEFISASAIFKALDDQDRNLMRDQQRAMMDYSDALEGRIARFTDQPA